MQFFTEEQLRKAHEIGAVQAVTLRAEGSSFEVLVETLRGVFALEKIRKPEGKAEVRRFADPGEALLLLHELGIDEARVDGTAWRPTEKSDLRGARPDQAVVLKAAYAALSHSDWVAQKVQVSRDGLTDGSNHRIDPDEWAQIKAEKKARRERG